MGGPGRGLPLGHGRELALDRLLGGLVGHPEAGGEGVQVGLVLLLGGVVSGLVLGRDGPRATLGGWRGTTFDHGGDGVLVLVRRLPAAGELGLLGIGHAWSVPAAAPPQAAAWPALRFLIAWAGQMGEQA